jgi:YVTN family beta-propeller protein
MKKIYFLLFLVYSFIAFSCSDDVVNNNVITTTKGVFIMSEGSMTPGSAKLSYYNSVKDSFYVNIFNPSSFGLFPDGLIKANDNLYITEQGNYNSPGKIYKTDMNGTIIDQKAVGLNPFSLCNANNKFYVTNGPAGNVSVLNSSLDAVTTIATGVYPQEITAFAGKVYVCNTSLYGGPYDSTISVIDANSDAIIKTLKTDRDPSSIAFTNDNKLIAGCPGANGKLFIFETMTYTLADTISSPYGFSKDLSVDKLSNNIYFIGYAGDIIKLNLDTRTFSKFIPLPSASSYIYGYSYDYLSSQHYLLDAKNFTGNGIFYIYSSSGTLVKNFNTGVAPRRLLIYK